MLKGDCVWVTHFKHKNLHKYTRVARDQEEVEVKSMLDLVLAKKDMLHFVQDEASQITMLYCLKSGWWGHGLRGDK